MKACAAVKGDANKALDQLDAVATEARSDLGYVLCRDQMDDAKDRIDEAARLMLAAAPETMALQDTDEWWRERRMLARKLLDQGEFQTAYDVVARDAALPANEILSRRIPFHAAAGLRCAISTIPRPRVTHFAMIDEGSANPIVLARANYWRGRAAEAIGDKPPMRAEL